MVNIMTLANKARALGILVDNTDWAIAIKSLDNRIVVTTIQGRIDESFDSIKLDKYFVIGYLNESGKKGKVAKVYVKNSIKPVRVRAKIRNVYIPIDSRDPEAKFSVSGDALQFIEEPLRRCGWAALLECRTANYLVNDAGNVVKLQNHINHIELDNEQDCIFLYSTFYEAISSEPRGVISHSLRAATNQNIIIR